MGCGTLIHILSECTPNHSIERMSNRLRSCQTLGQQELPEYMANIEIPAEAKQAKSVVEGVLGDSIIGIYLFGSAVVGGLKRSRLWRVLCSNGNSR